MFEKKAFSIPASLNEFLEQTNLAYLNSLESIPLFDPQITSSWSKHQISHFASVFYHLRGHFINFAWYIANFSKSEQTKKIIMDNLQEELGLGSRFSHEALFERFATECGVNIHDEIINETNYLPFAKEFNRIHLQWLSEHTPEEQLAAFAAYERLDNLDYPLLVKMANTLKLPQHALAFFNVHIHVTHFESTMELLIPVWQQTPERIMKAFEFIYSHQINMWKQLSQDIANRNSST